MKGFARRFLALGLSLLLPAGAGAVSAAPGLTAANFREIYPAGEPIECGDAADGVRVVFHTDYNRLTYVSPDEEGYEYGKPIPVDKLVLELGGVTIPPVAKDTQRVAFGFTLSQEPGSFFHVGSSGFHVRFYVYPEAVYLGVKWAPGQEFGSIEKPNTGDDIYVPLTKVPGWKRFPSSLKVQIYKTGTAYTLAFNEFAVTAPAARLEADISRSGKAFFNIGVEERRNQKPVSMTIRGLYTDPTLGSAPPATTAPATRSPSVTAPPAASPETSASKAPAKTTAPPPASAVSAGETSSAPPTTQAAPDFSDAPASSALPADGPGEPAGGFPSGWIAAAAVVLVGGGFALWRFVFRKRKGEDAP